ncbi:related to retrotransposon protein [Ustilago bromivora]|uniref:Related to retrotransposon protein n=1 Tax=Ustilago bromivora TaxID=307758 RepID=A0A8H8TU79_9BASI|nr:related to retrotransposon protein [Ustilago bromivora]
MVSDKADLNDLGYMKENLFDERDKEPLHKYMDMKATTEMNEEETPNDGSAEPAKHNSNTENWIDSNHFGFTAASTGKGKNLDPTVQEALTGEDRRHWQEAM